MTYSGAQFKFESAELVKLTLPAHLTFTASQMITVSVVHASLQQHQNDERSSSTTLVVHVIQEFKVFGLKSEHERIIVRAKDLDNTKAVLNVIGENFQKEPSTPYVCKLVDLNRVQEELDLSSASDEQVYTAVWLDKNELKCKVEDTSGIVTGTYSLLLGIEGNAQFFRVPHDIVVIDQAVVSHVTPRHIFGQVSA